MKKSKIYIALILFTCLIISSCTEDYLDVVPDNVATIDNAFAVRSQAKKYLFTCYSYMPDDSNHKINPAFFGGDEMWKTNETASKEIDQYVPMFDVAKGLQNVESPYGKRYWSGLYQGIRACNILLENIDRVPDMEETEKREWISEVKVLKAYYHFYLMRMYGPIPIVKENLPIDASVEEVKVVRQPVDSVVNYIVQLIDEAEENLPLTQNDPAMLGRITKPIGLSLKAKVLVTAASPLFNGNTDESSLLDEKGNPLFNQTYSEEKWQDAANACKAAIEVCEGVGMKLYTYTPVFQEVTDTINTELSIRNSYTLKWNSEIIWANTKAKMNNLQRMAQAYVDPQILQSSQIRGNLSPPLRIAEMFYSDNGVPIDEDKTYDYNNRYSLQTAKADMKLYIEKGYTTAKLNFNREPRFYADLGFDGGIWYGNGKYDDQKELWHIEAKYGQWQSKIGTHNSVTGYFAKKMVYYENVIAENNRYTITKYPFPLMRLSGLYLLYSEALNEAQGPGTEVYEYINRVRERAGLESVESSWSNYSSNPSKYTSKEGMRDIIHQERLIELAFEAQRFWDLRRWKEAAEKLNNPIKGWDVTQANAEDYYQPTILFFQEFKRRDYLWPIAEGEITRNRNLIQNIGW